MENPVVEKSEQEQVSVNNKALGSYIRIVLDSLPKKESPFEKGSFSTQYFPLKDDSGIVDTIYFSNFPIWWGRKDIQAYSMHVKYKAKAPQNFIEFRDYHDNSHVVKRVSSTFRFFTDGETDFVHTMPEVGEPPPADLTPDDLQNFLTPLDLDREEFKDKITKIGGKPSEHEPMGGWKYAAMVRDESWGELVVHILDQFSTQYANEYPAIPHFREYVQKFMEDHQES